MSFCFLFAMQGEKQEIENRYDYTNYSTLFYKVTRILYISHGTGFSAIQRATCAENQTSKPQPEGAILHFCLTVF